MVDLSIKKVLILGSTGMAGHVITRYLDNIGKYDVINSSRSKLNSKTILIDINNISSVENLIKTRTLIKLFLLIAIFPINLRV